MDEAKKAAILGAWFEHKLHEYDYSEVRATDAIRRIVRVLVETPVDQIETLLMTVVCKEPHKEELSYCAMAGMSDNIQQAAIMQLREIHDRINADYTEPED